jgi:predicted cupin superfamily sugar epimerase
VLADEIIERYAMQPIPQEGGWFAAGPRTPSLSGVTVLLTDRPDGFSAIHRLELDEGWQWLDGAPVTMLTLAGRSGASRDGRVHRLDRACAQAMVPAGTWQGARTVGEWSLVACWCAPQFTEEHFSLGERGYLLEHFPEFCDDILALTRRMP